MKLRASVLAAPTFCIVGALCAAPLHAADLLEVYQRALQSDPSIREAEANRLAALESRPQARAGLLPELFASGSLEKSESEFTRTQLDFEDPNDPTSSLVPVDLTSESDVDSTRYQIQLTQPLFRWDRWVRLRRADREAAQAEVEFRAAQQDLIGRVAQRYFDVLAAEDALEAAQATLDAFSRQLEQADKRFEVGLIAITDVQEARAARDQAAAAVIQAKRTLTTSQEFLREVTGDTFGDLAEPREDMPLRTPDPVGEEHWVKAALEQNLSLLAARLATDIAREDVRSARAQHLPSIDLFARRSSFEDQGDQVISTRGGSSVQPADQESTDDTIGVQVTVPIYSGGAISSQVRQSVYLHRAARERSERVARETERAARDAYLGVSSEISRVAALRQALESSQTALQATEAGFEVGTRTTVDVLDARRRLFEAQTNYLRSRYDYIINLLNLKIATGTLQRTDLEEINGWLQE